MNNMVNKNQKAIDNIIYLIMVFSLVYLFGIALNLDLQIIMQILIVLLICTIIKFFLYNPLYLYILLIILLILSLLINYYFPNTITSILNKIYLFFENIISYLSGKEDMATENILIFWCLLTSIVSLYTSFIIFKNKKFYLLLPIYMGAFIYYWYVYFDEAYWMIALFIFLFLILIGSNRYFKTHDNLEAYKPWVKTILLYSLIIVIVSLILPKNSNHIHWSWLKNKTYNMFPGIEDLRSADNFNRGYGNASDFQFSKTGYQENSSKLGGPVHLKEDVIMTVQGHGPLYLRGNIKHIYTGNSWKAADTPWESYQLGEDFSHIPQKDKQTYYREHKVTITNRAFASTTIFTPYRPTSVIFEGDHQIKINPDYEIAIPHGIYSGESYTVKFLKPHHPEALINMGKKDKKENIDNLNLYLQLPEDKITENTKELVEKIIKNSNTPLKKAMAIEKYLRNNYKYNLNVEKVPKNREFVDYFLFESKEGYCTYYATAMAVMLRIEGIPSRYVEGYLAREETNKNTYIVREKNAHAWVEAYIEPIGWISFEPTPAYPTLGETKKDNYKKDLQTENLQNTHPDKKSEDLIVDMQKPLLNPNLNMKEDNANTSIGKEIDTLPKVLEKFPMILIGIVILLIIIRFLIKFIKFKYRKIKFSKLPNKEKVIYLYNDIIKLIQLLGYSPKAGETHYEYANRIAHSFYTFGSAGIKDITEIFVKNKYSLEPTPEEDILKMEEYKKTLERRLKNHLGFINYYGKYFKL